MTTKKKSVTVVKEARVKKAPAKPKAPAKTKLEKALEAEPAQHEPTDEELTVGIPSRHVYDVNTQGIQKKATNYV